MTPAGPEPERVVQVRAQPSFGTGYRIGPGLVLTAAHVVAAPDGARPARVAVSRPGQAETEGEVVWCRRDTSVDAALIRLGPHGGDDAPRGAPVTRYGSFVSAQPDRQVEAIGFPRLQKYESLRDQEHFSGLLSPATGAGSGHYEFTSTTPLPGGAPDGTKTPWAGMSGAAVFAGGLLVGVVRQDRRASWGTRLTATPLSTLLADEAFRRTVAGASGWEPVCEPVELSGFLQPPYASRDIRSVASLLRADAEVVAFHGRETVGERLAAWCAGPDTSAALIVTGQGGVGKSRLARWFLARQRALGWTTGLLRPALADDAVTEERFAAVARTGGPLLIAVDYAENHPRQVRALLRQARAARGPVRVLLLARERGVWAEALDEPDAGVRDMLAEAEVLSLDPLAPTEESWDASFRRSSRDLARALGTVPGHQGPDWDAIAEQLDPPPADTHPRPDSALGIQMTALTLLLQQAVPVTSVRGEPVERTLLRHEEAYWTRAAQRSGLRGLDHTTLRSAVAALHLVDVADRAQAAGLLGALGVRDADDGRVAARWLHELYPPVDDSYCGSVQPDRLAEYLLVAACTDDDDLLTRIVSAAARCAGRQVAAYFAAHPEHGDASTFGQMMALRDAVGVARSQANLGHPVRPLLDQIERTASSAVISDKTLRWAISNTQTLPPPGRKQDVRKNADGSFTFTTVLDKASAALAVAGYRRGAHPLTGRDPRQQGYVHMMHSLSLAQVGRTREALDMSERAVESFRSTPGGEQHLAGELHRQAELLLELGRADEAVVALGEVVRLRGPGEPAGDEEGLRTSLDRLVLTLCQAGRFAEARPYARQETELLRRRAGTDPDTARPYVIALGRYAQVLEATGDLTAALDRCTRLESFLTTLTASCLDQLIAERALLADTRAQILGALGDEPAAVAAWLEGARLWQRVDAPYQQQNPVVRAVMDLNNAAVGHHGLGDRHTALALIGEAVELALGERGETLRRERPELYEQVHATHVGYLVQAGRAHEALHEAERLWDRPAPSPTPLPAHFANSLREAGLALAGARRLTEAARASRIAVAALHALAPHSDDTTLPMLLAATLADHAANLAETGQHTEGAEAASQAAAAWRRVCAGRPELRVNLATALANQAACLRLGARPADAARAFEEAAAALRDQAQGSARERQLLADMLGGQAMCHVEAGDPAAAARARTEEAEIRRALWNADPAAGPRAARSCTELALLLQELGRPSEAVSAVKEALGIYIEVYGPEPGANWHEVSHALMVCGTSLLKSGQAAEAVAPFLRAMAICLKAGDTEKAAACRSAIGLASSLDPAGVAAEWRRMVGSEFPGAVAPPHGSGPQEGAPPPGR